MTQIPTDLSQFGLTAQPTSSAADDSTTEAASNFGLTPQPLVGLDAKPRKPTADEFFRAADENPNRNWADKVMANVGPLGRGAARGGQAVGDFVVNSLFRGLSYIPGAEGLSDKADHNNRVSQLQRAYDMHLDETGTFAEVAGPGAAKVLGSLGESAADYALTAGAGKLAKIKTPKGFVNWMAATQGARETERALTQATDAGLEGPQRLVYAGAKGAVTALFTKGFAMLGDKIGGQTTEQLLGQGTRALDGLFTRSGLKQELLGMALEAGQNEGQAASQAMWDQLNGMNSWDDYKKHFGEQAVQGMVSRGVFGAGKRLADKMSKVVADMPDTVQGTLDAQKVKAGETVEPKAEASDAYKAAYDGELEALAQLEGEVNKRLEPIRGKQKAHEEEVAKAAEFETQINTLKKELADNGNVESPQREKLQSELDQMKAQLDAELDRLTTQEKTLKTEELKSQRSTNDDKQYIESELTRLMDEQDSRGHADEVTNMTSAKQAMLAAQRERFGFTKIEDPQTKHFEDMLTSAKAKNIPERARDIAADGLQNGTIWDDDTTVGVGVRYHDVVDNLQQTREAIRTASPENLDTLLQNEAQLKQEADFYSNALYRSGTAQGRALVSRKLTLGDVEDPATALVRAKRNKVANIGGVKKLESLEATQKKLKEQKANLKPGESSEKIDADLAAAEAKLGKTDLTDEEKNNILDSASKVRDLKAQRDKLKPGTDEYDDADLAVWKAQNEFAAAQEAPIKAGLGQRAAEMNMLWRTWHTSADFGAVGSQAGKSLLSNPIMTAKNMGEMLHSFASEKATFKIDRELANRPNSDLYDQGYITLLKENDPFSKREGGLASSLFAHMKGVKNFERAFRTMVNKTRADLFDYRVGLEGGRASLTDENLRGLGQAVDVFTGRGGRGYAENWANQASLVAYAPRYALAEAEFMLGRPLWNTDPSTRRMVANMYGRTLANMGWLYAAGGMANAIAEANGEPDLMEFDFDPKSPNFANVKLGNTWVDPTFRMARGVRLLANTATLISHTINGKGDDNAIKIPGHTSRSGLLPQKSTKDSTLLTRVGNFFRGKASLPVGAVVDLTKGSHITGEKVTWQSMAKQYGVPIAGGDIYKSMTSDYGMPEKTAQAVMAAFGIPMHPDYPDKGGAIKIPRK